MTATPGLQGLEGHGAAKRPAGSPVQNRKLNKHAAGRHPITKNKQHSLTAEQADLVINTRHIHLQNTSLNSQLA